MDAQTVLNKVKEIDPKTYQLAIALCQRDALAAENAVLKAQVQRETDEES